MADQYHNWMDGQPVWNPKIHCMTMGVGINNEGKWIGNNDKCEKTSLLCEAKVAEGTTAYLKGWDWFN